MVCSDIMICKNMYVKSRAIIRFHDSNLKKIGLTYVQSLVLLVLNENGPSFVDYVSKKLDLDTGTITPMVKKLIAKGLVIKARDKSDERRVSLELTANGKVLIADVENILSKAIEKLNMSNEEHEIFSRLLNKINI